MKNKPYGILLRLLLVATESEAEKRHHLEATAVQANTVDSSPNHNSPAYSEVSKIFVVSALGYPKVPSTDGKAPLSDDTILLRFALSI